LYGQSDKLETVVSLTELTTCIGDSRVRAVKKKQENGYKYRV